MNIANSYYKSKARRKMKQFNLGGDMYYEEQPEKTAGTIGGGMLKMGASGAAMGASVAGPWGAAIGAVVGAGAGLFTTRSAQKKDARKQADYTGRIQKMQTQAAMNRFAVDPELATGRVKGSYFATGGTLPDNPGKKKRDRTKQITNNYKIYNGIVDENGKHVDAPTIDQSIKTMVEYMKSNTPSSNIYRSQFQHFGFVDNPFKKKPLVAANGGSIARKYRGGGLVPKSSDGVEVQGPSHAKGGVKLPGANVEVEGGETIKDDFVFSKQLGFADLHKPLMRAKGKIEQKPATAERMNALRLIEEKENNLGLAQEYLKKKLKIT